MGIDDKIDNASEEATGKLKEGAGRTTSDERLEAEGRRDQTTANIKQAGEKIKDAFKS
ncbi:CsbD family protein [Micromonospora sp. WMMD558]|uniref:CsbD family protein n=1 Tax=Micromonospora sp. WMMD558 TaxID=3403462 RepID=UPI003BF5D96F